ncbi:MAG: acetyl-CoA carboxylase biotin carboxyl carrier protein [Elusimicrobiota bacterium]|nr:acetyl-CoA carboxylase biotin carboxyl carrier protein [Elusimicrobiota bacterium]
MPKKTGTQKNGNGSGPLSALKEVYAFMTANGLDAVEVTHEGEHVKLVRRKAAVSHVPVPVAVPMAGAAPQYAAPAAGGAPAPAAPAAPALPAGTAVKSPMMGIFYRASSPSSPPFCKEGDKVSAGQVICMIEAMKVFNEIKAEFPGTVVKVLVENGKPVKSGQDLYIIAR